MNPFNPPKFSSKFLILIFIAVLSSCTTDGDEEKETPSNERNGIEVGTVFYELEKSFVNFGTDPEDDNGKDIYYHEIVMTSSDVELNEANEDFPGTENSHAVVMTITSTSQSIPTGTYTVKTWSDGEGFDTVWCYIRTPLSTIDMEGTVKLEQEGNKISVQFNGLTGEDNQEVTGSYSGEFEEFNFYIN